MVIVDTSVWVDHLRRADPVLSSLLEAGRVLGHPWVIGELALGSLRDREVVLGLLRRLPSAPVASAAETMFLIERQGLADTGVGWVDVALLASARLAGATTVWTRDRRLAGAAGHLGLGFSGSAG